jgi:hypothetical protein
VSAPFFDHTRGPPRVQSRPLIFCCESCASWSQTCHNPHATLVLRTGGASVQSHLPHAKSDFRRGSPTVYSYYLDVLNRPPLHIERSMPKSRIRARTELMGDRQRKLASISNRDRDITPRDLSQRNTTATSKDQPVLLYPRQTLSYLKTILCKHRLSSIMIPPNTATVTCRSSRFISSCGKDTVGAD